MKRSINLVLLTTLMAAMLAACGGQTTTTNTNSGNTNTGTTNTNTTTNTNENMNANMNSNENMNVNMNSNMNSNENMNANMNSNMNSNENMNANMNSNMNSNENMNANMNSNTNASGSTGTGGSITIVSSLPRTGSSKGQTDTIVNAIKQRFAKDNNTACNGAITINYQDLDDATAAKGSWDEAQEASNANKASADPSVMVYIGTFNSGAAKISIPILNQANLVMISPANTYPGLTKPGKGTANEPDVYYPNGKRNYARVVPADDIQGAAAAKFAQAQGIKSVYILDDSELYGKGIADVFNKTAAAGGITVQGQESIDPKAADYRALAAKILDQNPDMVYFGGITQNNAGQLWKDIRGEGYKGKMMGPDGIFEQAFLEAAGADNAESTYVTFGGLPPDQLKGAGAEWYTAYKQQFSSEPEAYAVYGYEAANAAMFAINQVCKVDREAIRDQVMKTEDFDGVLGKWSFDANGDTSLTTMSIQEVKGGKFEFLQVIE